MLNQKKLNTKILKNALQVKLFSKSTTFSGQSYVDLDVSLPTGATIQAVSLTQAPNPNWISCAIASYGASAVRVSYNNAFSGSISGTVEVAVFYTI